MQQGSRPGTDVQQARHPGPGGVGALQHATPGKSKARVTTECDGANLARVWDVHRAGGVRVPPCKHRQLRQPLPFGANKQQKIFSQMWQSHMRPAGPSRGSKAHMSTHMSTHMSEHMCAHVSAHISLCTHVPAHVCTHVHEHSSTDLHAHGCTHAYTHIYTTSTYMSVQTVSAHVYAHVYTHVCTHACAHIYTQVCTQVYTRVHTYA